MIIRQNRQWMKFDAFFVQFLGLVGRSFAVDRAVLGLAIMDLARLFRKARTDIIRVLGDVVAQFLKLLPQLAFRRRHHRDGVLWRNRPEPPPNPYPASGGGWGRG